MTDGTLTDRAWVLVPHLSNTSALLLLAFTREWETTTEALDYFPPDKVAALVGVSEGTAAANLRALCKPVPRRSKVGADTEFPAPLAPHYYLDEPEGTLLPQRRVAYVPGPGLDERSAVDEILDGAEAVPDDFDEAEAGFEGTDPEG